MRTLTLIAFMMVFSLSLAFAQTPMPSNTTQGSVPAVETPKSAKVEAKKKTTKKEAKVKKEKKVKKNKETDTQKTLNKN